MCHSELKLNISELIELFKSNVNMHIFRFIFIAVQNIIKVSIIKQVESIPESFIVNIRSYNIIMTDLDSPNNSSLYLAQLKTTVIHINLNRNATCSLLVTECTVVYIIYTLINSYIAAEF